MQWLHLYPHVGNRMLPGNVFDVHAWPLGVAERFCSWISIHHVCHVCHFLFVIVAFYNLYGDMWLPCTLTAPFIMDVLCAFLCLGELFEKRDSFGNG